MLRTTGERIFDRANQAGMLLFMLTTLYPIWYIFIISLTDTSASSTIHLVLLPGKITLDSYRAVILNKSLLGGFTVSLLRVVSGVALTLANCAMMAYVLSRDHFRAGKAFNLLIVISMFLSAGMVPFFLVVRSLGLVNSFWGLVLPFAYDAFGIILMRNYFRNIPKSLEESARMDGANDVHVFGWIILPISLPILATMVLFWAVWFWNDFLYATFLVTKKNLQPVQVILLQIINGVNNASSLGKLSGRGIVLRTNGEAVKNAAILLSIVPILVVYPFVQKYFVQGITLGAVKE